MAQQRSLTTALISSSSYSRYLQKGLIRALTRPGSSKFSKYGWNLSQSQLASLGTTGSLDPRRYANAMRPKAVTSSRREAYSHRFSLVAQLESCGKQALSCVRFSARNGSQNKYRTNPGASSIGVNESARTGRSKVPLA